MMKIRVLIADDHDLIRKGIRGVLEEFQDFEIVGEAGDGPTLFQLIPRTRPDCVLIDVAMPDFEPISAIHKIHQEYPEIRLLVVSAYDDNIYVQGLLAAGVSGYHLKGQSLNDLVLAIRRILRGERWLSGPLVEKLIDQRVSKPSHNRLTERQTELLSLLQRGLDNKSIAQQLQISVKTVENSLTRLYFVLNVQSRLEAVRYANEHPDLFPSHSNIETPKTVVPELAPPMPSTSSSISILLIDDNNHYRNQFCKTVKIANPHAVVYEAENIESAVDLVQNRDIQLAFVDMILGRESGIICTQRIKEVSPQSRIILMSAYPDREFRRQGLAAGALVFVDKKDIDLSTLRQIIQDVNPSF